MFGIFYNIKNNQINLTNEQTDQTCHELSMYCTLMQKHINTISHLWNPKKNTIQSNTTCYFQNISFNTNAENHRYRVFMPLYNNSYLHM